MNDQEQPTADVTVGRKHYIGGSEAKGILSLPPYGCQLSLLLDKCGVGNDPGEVDINPRFAERGHMLEPVAAQLFTEDTDTPLYVLEEYSSSLRERHSWLVAHADYAIPFLSAASWAKMCGRLEDGPDAPTSNPETEGLLEIKTAGEWAFNQILKEGLAPYNLAQVQHQMIALGKTWAVLWILAPESFRRKGFLIGLDPTFRDDYLRAGDQLWAKIERAQKYLNPSDSPDKWTEFGVSRLDPKSPQCKKCKRRKSCQGAELAQILKMPDAGRVVSMADEPRWAAAASEFMQLASIEAQAGEAKLEQRAVLEMLMGDATCAEGAGLRINWKPQAGRVAPDAKGMIAALRALAIEVGPGELATTIAEIAGKTKTSAATRPFKPYQV